MPLCDRTYRSAFNKKGWLGFIVSDLLQDVRHLSLIEHSTDYAAFGHDRTAIALLQAIQRL